MRIKWANFCRAFRTEPGTLKKLAAIIIITGLFPPVPQEVLVFPHPKVRSKGASVN